MKKNISYLLAISLGLLAGWVNHHILYEVATFISEIFVNLLKLVSLPIIFLSIVSTASGMKSMHEMRNLGFKVAKYTLLTTIIAATIALGLFVILDPVTTFADQSLPVVANASKGYMAYLKEVIPSNFVKPFSENNVLGVLILAAFLSFSTLALEESKRVVIHSFFSSLYAAIMKLTQWIVQLMPFAIFAFVTLFVKEMRSEMQMASIALYLSCVLLSNVVQGLIVLPLLLKMKGISPWKTAKGMFDALSCAFFTKSSSAALPLAMSCAKNNLKVSEKVANFSFPLCTTINMNGCAAFILITVLFVSMSHGVIYSPIEMVLWIFIATMAAIGNAGVPMGCYFLASAFLASMQVPLNILGIILPFYALIDMVETALNVWSDACVTVCVEQEVMEEAEGRVADSQTVTV